MEVEVSEACRMKPRCDCAEDFVLGDGLMSCKRQAARPRGKGASGRATGVPKQRTRCSPRDI